MFQFTILHLLLIVACFGIIIKCKLYPILSCGGYYGKLNCKWILFTIILFLSFHIYIIVFAGAFLVIFLLSYVMSRLPRFTSVGTIGTDMEIKPISLKMLFSSIFKVDLVYGYLFFILCWYLSPTVECFFYVYVLFCMLVGELLGISSSSGY